MQYQLQQQNQGRLPMGRRTSTRMQKDFPLYEHQNLAAGGGQDLHSWQLEGGDEECQIKRLVISGAGTGSPISIKVALADEPFVSSAQFTDQRGIAEFVVSGDQIIDRVTTIRVPREWHLGLLAENLGTAVGGYACIPGLHYLVLS